MKNFEVTPQQMQDIFNTMQEMRSMISVNAKQLNAMEAFFRQIVEPKEQEQKTESNEN